MSAAIKRIVSLRCIYVYITVLVALIFIKGVDTDNLLVELLGGIPSNDGGYGINIFEIIYWNMVVLPPISTSILFMMEETGALSSYTMIRSQRIGLWWTGRFIPMMIANLLYIAVAILIVWVLGGISFDDSFFTVVFLFSLHTTMVSAILATLLVVTQSVPFVIVVFAMIELFGVAVGSLSSDLGKYTLALWGMANNSYYFFEDGYTHIWITSGVMVVIIACSYAMTGQWLRKHNPTETHRLKI